MKIKFLECEELDHIQISYSAKYSKEIQYIRQLLQNYMTHIKGFDEEHNTCYIRVMDIYYLEIVDSKCFIYTKDLTYKASLMFKDLKIKLIKHGFVPCSKSIIVNMHHVIQCRVYTECRRVLTMDNGEQIVVNRKFRKQFDEEYAKDLL